MWPGKLIVPHSSAPANDLTMNFYTLVALCYLATKIESIKKVTKISLQKLHISGSKSFVCLKMCTGCTFQISVTQYD